MLRCYCLLGGTARSLTVLIEGGGVTCPRQGREAGRWSYCFTRPPKGGGTGVHVGHVGSWPRRYIGPDRAAHVRGASRLRTAPGLCGRRRTRGFLQKADISKGGHTGQLALLLRSRWSWSLCILWAASCAFVGVEWAVPVVYVHGLQRRARCVRLAA